MQLADLPSRRTEAWKWSDLRAAMANHEAALRPLDAHEGASPIAGLARALSNAESIHRITLRDARSAWTTNVREGRGAVSTFIVPVASFSCTMSADLCWCEAS